MKTHKSSNDERIVILEVNMSHIQETLQRIEKRFDIIDKKFDKIDQKFDKVDSQFSELRKEIIDVRKESWSQFRWTIGFICVLFGMPIIQNIIIHFIGK